MSDGGLRACSEQVNRFKSWARNRLYLRLVVPGLAYV
jgi:hypothetical protein